MNLTKNLIQKFPVIDKWFDYPFNVNLNMGLLPLKVIRDMSKYHSGSICEIASFDCHSKKL